jgi:hypothetical protein
MFQQASGVAVASPRDQQPKDRKQLVQVLRHSSLAGEWMAAPATSNSGPSSFGIDLPKVCAEYEKWSKNGLTD